MIYNKRYIIEEISLTIFLFNIDRVAILNLISKMRYASRMQMTATRQNSRNSQSVRLPNYISLSRLFLTHLKRSTSGYKRF